MSVEATTVVSYNTSSSNPEYKFNIDLDDTLNLDADGKTKTSFTPNDTAVFIEVNKSSNVVINQVKLTRGSIAHLGSVNRSSNKDTHLFTNIEKPEDDTFTLNLIPSVVDVEYIGNTGGLEKDVSGIGVVTFTPDVTKTPFISKFLIQYVAESYRVTPPPMSLTEEESFQLAVVFYITVSD